MILLFVAIAALAIWAVLLLGRGAFWMARERDDVPLADPAAWPKVAAVIPARDEADMIGATLESLLRQDYPGDFSVVLVDDGSSDGTSDTARASAAKLDATDHLTIVPGKPLAQGWTGKLYAMKQGTDHLAALPEPPKYVLFTDADIVHLPDSLRSLVARAEARSLVMVSLMAKLRCRSLAERALVPAFVFFFAMLFPFGWVNDSRRRTAAAAGGCMLVDRTALETAGGVGAVRGELIDDCAMGRLMKTRGPVRLLLTERVESRRIYETWGAIRQMVVRSAYAQLRYSPWVLAGTIVGLALTYLAAPTLALFASGWPQAIGVTVWVAMALAFQPMLAFYRLSPFWGLALPAIAAVYAAFTLDSARLYYAGKGGNWKGRAQAMGASFSRREKVAAERPDDGLRSAERPIAGDGPPREAKPIESSPHPPPPAAPSPYGRRIASPSPLPASGGRGFPQATP